MFTNVSYDTCRKGVDKLLKDLKPDSWVEYGKYIQYIFSTTLSNYEESVCHAHKKGIDQKEKDITHIVNSQSGDKWGQIGELFSNGIDASNLESCIGRFGIGFKQVLQELKNNTRVLVITKTQKESYGRLIEFASITQGNTDKIYVRDGKSTAIQEVGTRIIVQRRLTKEEQIGEEGIRGYVFKKYSCCRFAKIRFNDELVNTFKDMKGILGDSIDCINQKAVDIFVNDYGYEIKDAGSGMSDEIIYKHFLPTRASTKKADPGGEDLFYLDRPKAKNQKSLIRFLLSGVIVEEYHVNDPNLPSEVMISFPHQTILSSSRSGVNIDHVLIAGLEKIIKNIFEQQSSADSKITLMNYLVSILKILNEGSRGRDGGDSIQALKGKIRTGLMGILDPKKIYLPRIKECDFFAIDSAEELRLDPEIYPEKIIEQIPGIQRIRTFDSERGYKAYSLPFKNDTQDRKVPVYVDFGSMKILVMNREIHDLYKENAPEFLNLMINYYIGYGAHLPEKGTFRKEIPKKQWDANANTSIDEDEIQNDEATQPLEKDEVTQEKNQPEEKVDIDPEDPEGTSKKLAEEWIKPFKPLKEEEIKIKSQQIFDSIGSGSGGSSSKEILKVERIEPLIKKYIEKRLREGDTDDNIKQVVVDFLERYRDLKLTSIGIITKNKNQPFHSDMVISEHVYSSINCDFHLNSTIKKFKKLPSRYNIEEVLEYKKDYYWASKKKSLRDCFDIYKNTKLIAYEVGKHHITSLKNNTLFKIHQNAIWWSVRGNNDNCTMVYKNETLKVSRNSSFTHFSRFTADNKKNISYYNHLTNYKILGNKVWYLEQKEAVCNIYRDDEKVISLDVIDDFDVVENNLWYIGNKKDDKMASIYKNNTPLLSGYYQIYFLKSTDENV